MKKAFSVIISLILLLSLLAACGTETPAVEESASAASEDTLRIVTTIFPEYDWVMNILGDRAGQAEVSMLLDSGVDLHSYQPTVDDVASIADCDLFIYVGGESDSWVDSALAETDRDSVKVINLMDALGDEVKEEEVVEGMEAEHDHEESEEHDHEEEVEFDEHVWLSLGNACDLCGVIEDALSEIDPDNAESYAANTEDYVRQLTALDEEYETAVEQASVKTLLFGDRFPFRYLVDDYDLDYYAAFAGCSAETEASFETIVFLAGKIDELGLKSICQIESSDGTIARTIRDNTRGRNQEILILDSMQSVTADDVAHGASYLSIMEDNLAVLKAALK